LINVMARKVKIINEITSVFIDEIKDVELDLNSDNRQRSSHGAGRIRILLCDLKQDAAAATAIADAHEAANTVGASFVATIGEGVSNVQTAVLPLSGTLDALGAILSKIDIFVKIVDQVANVRAPRFL
jgi:hypothetical protein